MASASASAPAPDAITAGVSAPTFSKGSLREDLTCAVCCDLFREPVMLACMHHFCKLCICQYWRGTEGRVRCPQCRKEFNSKHYQTNYLISSIVEKIRVVTSDSYIENYQVSCLIIPVGCFQCTICVFRFHPCFLDCCLTLNVYCLDNTG